LDKKQGKKTRHQASITGMVFRWFIFPKEKSRVWSVTNGLRKFLGTSDARVSA
jgi:hypothetical protein